MTGAEFYAYVMRTFKRTGKETEMYEAISDAVAQIELDLNADKYKKESSALTITTLGDYEITLPTDIGVPVGRLKIEDDEDSYPLTKISKTEFDLLCPDPHYAYTSGDKGRPVKYCIWGGKILLYQVPDSISYEYILNYAYINTSAIVTGTATVPFSSIDDRIMLKYKALGLIWGDMEDDSRQQKYETLYQIELNRRQKREHRKTKPWPMQTRYRGI